MELLPIVVGLALAQVASEPVLLRPGEVQRGTLAEGDASIETEALRVGGYLAQQPVLARSFVLEVAAAGDYHVELRSHAFDGYLVARDAGGRVLAEDDDGLLGVHPRLLLSLEPGVPVELLACALHGQRGAFELRLLAGQPVPLTPLQRAEAEVDDLRARAAAQEAAEGAGGLGPAETLYALGERLRVLGRLDEAREHLEHALANFEAALGPQDVNVATILNGLALVHVARGDLAAARPLYERALAIDEQAYGPQHPFVATVLNNYGLLLVAIGEPETARPLYERALALWEAAYGSQHAHVAAVSSNLGSMHQALGDLAAARPLFERALATLEALHGPEHPDVATALDNLALLLALQGDHATALPLFARVLAIRTATRGAQHPEVAHVLVNSSNSLRAVGAVDLAREHLERALALFEASLGPQHISVAATLNSLGNMLAEEGEHPSAQPLLERALALREAQLGPQHPDVATSLNNLALLHQRLGAAQTARPLFERAQAIQERVLGVAHPHTAANLNNLAGLLADLGAHDEAIALLRRGSAARDAQLGALLASFGEGESHTYLAQLRWQLELQLSALAWGAPAREIYACQLAWKGRVLRLARCSSARLRAELPGEAGPLLDQMHALQARLSRGVGELEPTAGGVPADLATLAAQRQALERELRRLGGPLEVEVPGPEQLRAALPEGGALVDVLLHRLYEPAQHVDGRLLTPGRWSEPRALAWVTTAARAEPLRIDLGPAAALEAAIDAAREQLVGTRGSAVRQPVDALTRARQLLWEPLAAALGDATTVFVSPDGALATLPFEVLSDADGRYLVQDRSFVYLTDPTLLVESAGRPAAPAFGANLLAVGGVDYAHADRPGAPGSGNTDGSVASSVAVGAASSVGGSAAGITAGSASGPGSARGPLRPDVWRPLDAAGVEAEQVHTRHELLYPQAGRLLLRGAQVSEERLKAELPRHTLLHLATHGSFAPQGGSGAAGRFTSAHPGLLSALVCAGVNRGLPPERDDGYLTAEEVAWLDLSAVELAVLSACDTGLGQAQSGEGLLGLRRAFLMSGARTVIASLWAIDDQHTSELMDRFYRKLWQGGLGPAAALRAAQLEQLEQNRLRFDGDARPETWGAFILDGDWR